MANSLRPFPKAILDAVERRLSERLHSYVLKSEVPRCLLAFLDDGDYLQPRLSLKTDATWGIFWSSPETGLMGYALKQNDIVFWSQDGSWAGGEGAEYFWRGDARTRGEAAGAVLFKGMPTAVFLIDYFEGEILPDRLLLRTKVAKWIDEISGDLASLEREESELRAEIANYTLQCVRETRSIRGYTALKKWDGTIDYFPAGRDVEKFRYLDQLEGICGEVFRKGEFQNVSNVWGHPRYLSSDDKVFSEAVAPIILDQEVVGVLNMEAWERDHYNSNDVSKIKEYAQHLVPLADRHRIPVGSGLGVHSRLLSDLIESLSIPNEDIFDLAEAGRIDKWAFDILCRKVLNLEIVLAADVIESSSALIESNSVFKDACESRDGYRQVDGEESYCIFGIKHEGVVRVFLKTIFKEKPSRAILEIINQFCRITMNEVRRRDEESRSLEFERLLMDVKGGRGEETLHTAPYRVQRILDCDHATLFLSREDGGGVVLVPWSSTGGSLIYKTKETYYRSSVEEGFTGFAATRRDILLIKTVMDADELRQIHPRLKWKGKMVEEEEGPFRSYFAIPLYRGERLVALLRGHRSVKRRNSAFSEVDGDRIRLIKFLLELALGH
jgi:GAF domain-containing protein